MVIGLRIIHFRISSLYPPQGLISNRHILVDDSNPSSWAILMAVLDSVTVSMAALTKGIFKRMVPVNWVHVSTSLAKPMNKQEQQHIIKRQTFFNIFKMDSIVIPRSDQSISILYIKRIFICQLDRRVICNSDTGLQTLDNRFLHG